MAAEPPPISLRVREARERLEISQEEAARRLHLSLGAYRAYETRREPKPARAREIARAFGLAEDYFLTGPAGDGAEPTNADRLVALAERVEALERLNREILDVARQLLEGQQRGGTDTGQDP